MSPQVGLQVFGATSAQVATATQGRTPHLVVAANDASGRSKTGADYVCDGVADEVEINAAITALGATGGIVELTSGTFATDASVIMMSNCNLVGQGYEATIVQDFGGANIITIGDGGASFVGNIVIEGMRINASQTAGVQAIRLNKTHWVTLRRLYIGSAAVGITHRWSEFTKIEDVRMTGIYDIGIACENVANIEGHLSISDTTITLSSSGRTGQAGLDIFTDTPAGGTAIFEMPITRFHVVGAIAASGVDMIRLRGASRSARNIVFNSCTFEMLGASATDTDGVQIENDSNVVFIGCSWFGGTLMKYGVNATAGKVLADSCEFLTFPGSGSKDFNIVSPSTLTTRAITSVVGGDRGAPVLSSYTTALLPAASRYTGGIVYVSDATTGARLQYSNGSEWVVPSSKTLQERLAMPTGAIAESTSRITTPMSSQTALTSGVLRVGGPMLLPKGKTITTVTIGGGSTGATTPTHQWICLVRVSDLAVLVKSTDLTTAAWGTSVNPVFTLATTYTPTVEEFVWPALLVTAAAMPTLVGWSVNASVTAIAPILCGNSTTGLTDPASLGASILAPGSGSPIHYWAYVS